MKKWITILLCMLLPLAVGFVSGKITRENVINWYPFLEKPSFTPPNYLFGPVWTVLYLLMGVSLYLVVRQPASPNRTKALSLFSIQLLLNFWWSVFFFRFHLIAIALIDIILLLVFIILMIRSFFKLNKLASNLQWPYLAWVSFATALNMGIWVLN
ncbi:MAG TPA: TspO/MBR family protein [Niastella sp.]